MKGLLVKDMRILLRIKMSIFIILVLGIFMSFNNGDPSFSLGYMMMVSTVFVINTISYDYFENGMSFMFTLPVSRKAYVLEKYLLTFFIELAVTAVAVVIQLVAYAVTGTADWETFFITGIVCMVAASLLMAMYIPVNLKFGPEKSRIALFVFAGGIGGISYVVYKIEPLQRVMIRVVELLSGLTAVQAVCIAAGLWALLIAVTILISMRIMEKKEF